MNKIIDLLLEIRPDSNFLSSLNFIEDNLLDSFDVMTLVSELEEKYNIQISLDDILPENFQSVNAIADLVRKCSGTV